MRCPAAACVADAVDRVLAGRPAPRPLVQQLV